MTTDRNADRLAVRGIEADVAVADLGELADLLLRIR